MIEECFNCGISGKKVKLFDAVSKEGIVKICRECAIKEKTPIIEKHPEIDINNLNETVYEKLSRISGVNTRKKPFQKEENLREIVDKNFYRRIPKNPKPEFLVDNFHWIIMRARRLKHFSHKQVAEAIKEPELAIKFIEQGILAKNNYKLVEKIEKYLNIKITKEKFSDKSETTGKLFDVSESKDLTISDLKKKQEEREGEENIWEDKINIFTSETDLDLEQMKY